MSDFLFSSRPVAPGHLAAALAGIYSNKEREIACIEYHGTWGSLATTASCYPGFQPVETDDHVCVVIGGPVLYFQDNDFIAGNDPQAGTLAVLNRWQETPDWSEDLSGPFVILVIDKKTAKIECITDLMMFIPVYQFSAEGAVCWGTHIDALARACGEQRAFDEASLVDFVLHHAVTYPYTAYQNIRQCQAGSIHRWAGQKNGNGALADAQIYWQPLETSPPHSLSEAANYLRDGVQGYIERITAPLNRVAQFISAGEDSRALAGMLPGRLERDAYIFIDSMNREGLVADKVAKAYGANFRPDYRSQTHYLDILPEASDLVGTAHQYTHAHTLGFDKANNLSQYSAVFGGYISDSLLKAQYAKKPNWMRYFPFLPQVMAEGETRTQQVSNILFSPAILEEITRRRRAHYQQVRSIRPKSANEWFELWPATMRIALPNLYSNRRLFASHEVFMAKESVKIAAGVPVAWKLNRRLFNRAFRPALKKSKTVFHADGRLPYYPWWVNSTIQLPIWFFQNLKRVAQRAGIKMRNEGPWADWSRVVNSSRWAEEVERHTQCELPQAILLAVEQGVLLGGGMPIANKVNLLQVCYQVGRRKGGGRY